VIWNRTGGSDDGPLLVLMHGLGGTAELWRGVEALLPDRWPGGWLALDLPGHGRSPRAASYTFDAQAALVAEVLPEGRDLVLLGHSMGGMVALALAGFHPGVGRVVGFSIKTWWRRPPEPGWRIAQDMGTFDLGLPDMPALLAEVTCPVTLALGSEDRFVRPANYGELGVEVVTLEGLGHNPHVEDPSALVSLL